MFTCMIVSSINWAMLDCRLCGMYYAYRVSVVSDLQSVSDPVIVLTDRCRQPTRTTRDGPGAGTWLLPETQTGKMQVATAHSSGRCGLPRRCMMNRACLLELPDIRRSLEPVEDGAVRETASDPFRWEVTRPNKHALALAECSIGVEVCLRLLHGPPERRPLRGRKLTVDTEGVGGEGVRCGGTHGPWPAPGPGCLR